MHLLSCKPTSLPMDPNAKLSSTEGALLTDPTLYRRLIGCLSFVVHKLSQHMQQPRAPHLDVVNHLLRYLKSAPGQGLFFPRKNALNLTAFADADWSSCVDTRRSTTGFCVFLGGCSGLMEIQETTHSF